MIQLWPPGCLAQVTHTVASLNMGWDRKGASQWVLAAALLTQEALALMAMRPWLSLRLSVHRSCSLPQVPHGLGTGCSRPAAWMLRGP